MIDGFVATPKVLPASITTVELHSYTNEGVETLPTIRVDVLSSRRMQVKSGSLGTIAIVLSYLWLIRRVLSGHFQKSLHA